MMPAAAVRSDSSETPQAASEHVNAVVGASGSSFYWAMRILPKARRDAIFAVYAFCREVDDVADSDDPADTKICELQGWRQEVDRLYAGQPSCPTTLALQSALQDYGLEKDAFLAIIEGMEMDARGPIRAPSMADLEAYCARVASAVGLLCIRIFGEEGDDGIAVAQSLGLALQLTNILRDVREDAEMGRLYLPRELLDAHGIYATDPASDPIEVIRHPNLPEVCIELSRRAEAEFIKADEAIARCDARAMRPAIIMMRVYQRALVRMQRRGWQNVATWQEGRLAKALRRAEKILIALRHGLL